MTISYAFLALNKFWLDELSNAAILASVRIKKLQ